MAQGDAIGNIFNALGAGLAAAGGDDIYREFMQTLREKGPNSEKQDKINFGKIRLAALGYDVSGINSEEDLVAEESRIQRRGQQFDQTAAQFQEMVDVQEATTAQWREQDTPVDAAQIAGYEQGLARLQGIRQKLGGLAPPGTNTADYDYTLGRLGTGYDEAVALSDARSAGTLAEGGDWAGLAETWAKTDKNSRTAREMTRQPAVQFAFNAARQAHAALAGMREIADGTFVGPEQAVSLRAQLSDGDGNMLPWATIQADDKKLGLLLEAGASPRFQRDIEDAGTAFSADVEESEVRNLIGGFGVAMPDAGTFRNPDGSFDRVGFMRKTFGDAVEEREDMDIADLSRLAVNMKSVAQGGGPEAAVIADQLQKVTQTLLERFEGDPDGVLRAREKEEAARGAQFTDFLQGSLEEGALGLDFADLVPATLPGEKQYVYSGGSFPTLQTVRRAPNTYEERYGITMDILARAQTGTLTSQETRFLTVFNQLSPEARMEYLETGKPPGFDSGKAKELFVQGVMPPAVQVDIGELRGQMETHAGTLRSAGLDSAADAADLDVAYYREQEYGREVGVKGLRTVGLALAEYAEEGGDIEALVTRIAGDFPASAQQDLVGQTAQGRVGLENLEKELAKAEDTGQRALILLRNVENGIYNAAGLQFGTEGERTVARAEAQIVFTRIREQVQTLIDYQVEAKLTDKQMAEKLGGRGDDWVTPLFEALGEASLAL